LNEPGLEKIHDFEQEHAEGVNRRDFQADHWHHIPFQANETPAAALYLSRRSTMAKEDERRANEPARSPFPAFPTLPQGMRVKLWENGTPARNMAIPGKHVSDKNPGASYCQVDVVAREAVGKHLVA
jgi:hypothetical protein